MARITKRLQLVSIAGTDFSSSISSCHIDAADSDNDFVTFADAAAGGARTYTLVGTAVQDLATGSFWRQMWDNPGTTVAVILKPYGSGAASPTAPWVLGNAVVHEPNGTFIGGDADASATAYQTVDFEWTFTAKPTFQTS